MTDTLRLFIAVDLPKDVAERAAGLVERLRHAGVDTAWGRPKQWHITLSFLGSVAEDRLAAIRGGLEAAARQVPPFAVEWRGVGAFPNAANPRVIWLGVGRGGDRLGELAAAISAQLEPRGFPLEQRRFVPHVTLGRVQRRDPVAARRLATAIDALSAAECGTGVIDRVTLFSSTLERAGAVHRPLQTVALGSP